MAEQQAVPPGANPPAAAPASVVSAETATQAPPRRARGRMAEAYATRNLTEGNITNNLFFLAWPQMTEGALFVLYQMVDLFWAGQGFGLAAFAGVGVVWTYSNFALTARGGIDTAMRAMVARAVGAGDMALANRVVIQAFVLSTLITTAVVVVPGVIFAEQLLALLGIPPAVRDEVRLYMQVQFVNQGLVGWRTMSGAALLAAGDSLTPLRATFYTRAVHMVGSPLLAFGPWIIPEFGLMGLAAAGVLGQLMGSVMNWNALFSGKSRLHVTLRGFGFDWRIVGRLLRIGIPAGVTSMERAFSQLIMLGIVSSFGVTALGVYTLVNRSELFANRVLSGLAQAAGVIVGQNLGAGRPQRAKETVFVAAKYTFLSQVIFAGFLALFPSLYISIFNGNSELHALGAEWFRVMAIGFAAMGLGTVLTQCFNTAGDTMVPAIVNMGTIWLVQFPLALLLRDVFDFNSTAVAWAIVAALLLRLVAYIPYFFSDRWMKARVI